MKYLLGWTYLQVLKKHLSWGYLVDSLNTFWQGSKVQDDASLLTDNIYGLIIFTKLIIIFTKLIRINRKMKNTICLFLKPNSLSLSNSINMKYAEIKIDRWWECSHVDSSVNDLYLITGQKIFFRKKEVYTPSRWRKKKKKLERNGLEQQNSKINQPQNLYLHKYKQTM